MLLLGGICSLIFIFLFVFMLAMNRKMYQDLVKYCSLYYAENRKFNIAAFASSKTQSGIHKFLEDHGYKKVAVYGVGMIFHLFLEELKAMEGIEMKCYIDQYDTRKSINGVKLLKMEQVKEEFDIDVILVTVMYGYEKIEKQLKDLTGNKVRIVNIEEAVYWY